MNTKEYPAFGASLLRVVFFLLICALFALSTVALSIRLKLLPDEMIAAFIFDICFLLCFVIINLRKRLAGQFYSGRGYSLPFLGFLIVHILFFICEISPYDSFPIALIPLIFCGFLDAPLAIGTSLFMLVKYAYFFQLEIYTLFEYILIIVMTTFLAIYLKENRFKYKSLISILITLISFLISTVFLYLKNLHFDTKELVPAIICSIISGIFTMLCYNRICKVFAREERVSYETIIDVNYPILADIKRLSKAEFNHAVKVCNLSGKCADLIGVDRLLCMAGGLYYHASNLYPDIDDDRFCKHLNNRNFPPQVILLISEKGYEDAYPSTKESAIVHMIDALITKFEALYNKAGTSDWNINMIVYQTLNDFSSKGIYDKSGLSMNEFLKIRDYVAKADKYLK